MKTNRKKIMKRFVDNPIAQSQCNASVKVNIVRHGNVGDGKKHFTDKNVAKIQARIEDTFRYIDVMSLWKDL